MTRVGERRSAYVVLTGKFKGKIQVGRQRRGWKNSMQTGFQEIGWGNEDRIGLSGGGLLWMRWWSFEFHKMLGIYLIAEDKKVSALCSCAVNLCHLSVIRRWFFKSEMSYGFNMLRFKTIPWNISNKKYCHQYCDTKRICRPYFQLCNAYELKFVNEIAEPADLRNETTEATDLPNLPSQEDVQCLCSKLYSYHFTGCLQMRWTKIPDDHVSIVVVCQLRAEHLVRTVPGWHELFHRVCCAVPIRAIDCS